MQWVRFSSTLYRPQPAKISLILVEYSLRYSTCKIAENEKKLKNFFVDNFFRFLSPNISLSIKAARIKWLRFSSTLYRPQPAKISLILVEYSRRYSTCKIAENEKKLKNFIKCRQLLSTFEPTYFAKYKSSRPQPAKISLILVEYSRRYSTCKIAENEKKLKNFIKCRQLLSTFEPTYFAKYKSSKNAMGTI